MGESTNDLKEKISIAAYFLAKENHPYDTLCWMLAERQLFIQFNFRRPQEDLIRHKAAEIFFSNPNYDVLCWLIAEKNILIKDKKSERNSKHTF
ncbi:MAG: hypothetical protein ACFE8E_00930 [Candidatus Hodarchaeota archaeon]